MIFEDALLEASILFWYTSVIVLKLCFRLHRPRILFNVNRRKILSLGFKHKVELYYGWFRFYRYTVESEIILATLAFPLVSIFINYKRIMKGCVPSTPHTLNLLLLSFRVSGDAAIVKLFDYFYWIFQRVELFSYTYWLF